jgi:hypothetical protein
MSQAQLRECAEMVAYMEKQPRAFIPKRWREELKDLIAFMDSLGVSGGTEIVKWINKRIK